MKKNKSNNEIVSILDQDEFISQFFFYICMTHEYLSKPFIEFFRIEYGLNGNQMAAVGYLKQSGSMTMGELARKVDISKQQTTQLVNSLVEKGFVKRKVNKENRREIIVSATKFAVNSLIDGENKFLANAKNEIFNFLGDDTQKLEESLKYISKVIPQMNFSMDKKVLDKLNNKI